MAFPSLNYDLCVNQWLHHDLCLTWGGVICALQYEKAASELSSHSPPLVLAKIDASDEANKGIANEYQIQGFPTIKILRNGGKSVQDYNGPREADGIVTYVKKQSGPASAEIKSAAAAAEIVGGKNVVSVSSSEIFLFQKKKKGFFSI